MLKVLFFQSRLPHYRLSFFDELSKKIDGEITIAHSGEPMLLKSILKSKLNEIILKRKRFFYFFHQNKTLVLPGSFDIIVLPFDPRQTSFYLPFIFPHKKFLYFGIGFSKNNLANKLRCIAIKKNRVLLYTPKAVCDIINSVDLANVNNISFFNNTINVDKPLSFSSFEKRNTYLFVGSLDDRKGLENIIAAYYYFALVRSDIKLIVVGDGKAKLKIQALVRTLGLEDKVLFLGAITNTNILSEVFDKAIATIHFSQAGLSILQSLGHAVPCIVSKNAISGGEKTNAIDDYNSLVIEPYIADFSGAMISLANNSERWSFLSNNAIDYYQKNCSIDSMAEKFLKELKVIFDK